MTRTWMRWLGTFAVATLLFTAASTEARAADRSATAAAVAGSAMTVGGIALIPISVEYSVADGQLGGSAFLGWSIPTLLVPGIPTLVEGLVQVGTGDREVPDPRFTNAWCRARTGEWAPLYLVMGGLAGSMGLAASIGLGVSDEYFHVPSVVLPGIGLGVLGAGIFLAVDGERAMLQLPGELDGTPDEPGEIYIKSGITLFALGTGVLAAGSPLMRLALVQNPGMGPVPVIVTAGMGLAYMATGITFLAVGIQRKSRGWAPPPTASRSPLKLRVSGIAPIYDPHTQSVSIAVQGFSW